MLAALARGRSRSERDTLEALAEAVLRGLLDAGDEGLAAARVTVEADPAGGWVAAIELADDDAVARWSDALAETLGPLGTPRWMVAVGERAWRVPAAVGATRASAEAFAREGAAARSPPTRTGGSTRHPLSDPTARTEGDGRPWARNGPAPRSGAGPLPDQEGLTPAGS